MIVNIVDKIGKKKKTQLGKSLWTIFIYYFHNLILLEC